MKTNKLFLFLVSFVFSAGSVICKAQTDGPTPFETLQRALPAEISVRPKLSLHENLTTIFAELTTYARVTDARPDSNNLTPGWNSRQDRQLIEALLMHQDLFLPEGSESIKSYFTKRMSKALELKPYELWNDYNLVSKLFPQDNFWLPYYQTMLNTLTVRWNQVSTQEWIGNTLLPALFRDRHHSPLWSQTFFINLINLLKEDMRQVQESANPSPTPLNGHSGTVDKVVISPQGLAKVLFQTLEQVDLFFELMENHTKDINNSNLLEISQSYFDLLQNLIIQINQSNVLTTLWTSPSFKSPLLESAAISSLILGAQAHKIFIGLDSPRIKAYFGLHDQIVHWILKTDRLDHPVQKLRQAFETLLYLRTAISLKTELSNATDIISKGQWLSNKQFQRGMEMLWHEELNKAHSEVLRIIQLTLYNVSLIDKCYREKLQTPTCKKWRDSVPLEYVEHTNEKGLKKGQWELHSTTPIYFPPGQISLGENETLVLRAPEFRFNLLTRIAIPSGNVDVRANKVIFPWIDTSGNDASEGPKTTRSPGQRPWIKNSHACATRDYLEGVNLLKIPGRDQAKWVGFSMENPFPSHLLICSSSALAKTRENVADIEEMLDLGTPPESPETSIPLKGSPGGHIKIELDSSSDREGLQLPLLIAMGGDGSPGTDGQSSPLCQKGIYSSFKVGLSHHKNWFQKWIDYQATHPQLKLISKSEYEDHWYGTFEINLPRTGGSNGGDAGHGGRVTLILPSHQADSRPHRWFLSAGLPGEAGQSGLCGPNKVSDGKNGSTAHAGAMSFLRK